MGPEYQDQEDWDVEAEGCLYEVVTVGGAILATLLVTIGLWELISLIGDLFI